MKGPKPRDSIHVIIVSMGGVVILETIALLKGIDGTLFTLAIAALVGMAGFKLRDILR